MNARYIDTAEVAKIVRSELKAAFPGVKFAVRISRYSMGSEVLVKWVDGPTEKAVYGVVGMFCGASFDSLADLRTSHDTTYKGELVHFCNTAISCTRELSVEFVKPIAEKVARLWGFETPEVLESFGHAYIVQDYSKTIGRDCLASVIMQAAHETDARFSEQEETEEELIAEEPVIAPETTEEAPAVEFAPESIQTDGYTVVYEGDTTWIEFPAKPSGEILKTLKARLGARWNKARKAWQIGRTVALGEIMAELSGTPSQESIGIDELSTIKAILDKAGIPGSNLIERVARLVGEYEAIESMLLASL